LLTAFRTASAIPHYFNPYLEAYARQAWPIERELLGECTGAYFVEVGPQQRLIQTWVHADVADWADRRARLAANSEWRAFRAATAHMIRSESDRLFQPAPFMPVKNVTDAADFVEMRIYRAHTGVLDRFFEIYTAEGLPVQLAHLGNCLGYFRSVDGRVDEVVHLWGYAGLDDRIKRRTALFADPLFKKFLVKGVPHFSRQENMILRPAAFWRG
jgi:hypothetical protein